MQKMCMTLRLGPTCRVGHEKLVPLSHCKLQRAATTKALSGNPSETVGWSPVQGIITNLFVGGGMRKGKCVIKLLSSPEAVSPSRGFGAYQSGFRRCRNNVRVVACRPGRFAHVAGPDPTNQNRM